MTTQTTILVIEDHDESRFLYGEILRGENFNVVETIHGQEALDYLSKNPSPQLIVMDLTFPTMTASEFVSSLRANNNTKDTPILIISGQWDTAEQSKALKAQGYIKKPFDMDDFIQTVTKMSRSFE